MQLEHYNLPGYKLPGYNIDQVILIVHDLLPRGELLKMGGLYVLVMLNAYFILYWEFKGEGWITVVQ